MNFNAYNEDQYKLNFVNHRCMEVIKKDVMFDRVKLRFDSFFYVQEINHYSMDNTFNTPRLAALQLKSTFSVAPLYYLDFLLEKDPNVIVDIGCGANLFKRIIPCIHGIDSVPNNPYADEFGSFDTEFSQSHKDAYESAFSINSLHFIPLQDLEKQIKEFINIIKPGGRGFLTFNVARMLELTDKKARRQLFSTHIVDPNMIADYVRQVIQNTLVRFLVVDLCIDKELDEYMNGNIRLVFEK